jgi:DNA-binding FrmR family transcriptional regulator
MPWETTTMDKKAKKKIDTLHQRIQRLRQQLAGAKKQLDESAEAAALARQLAEAEADLAKLKEA